METSGSADRSRQVREKCNDVTLSKINSSWQGTSVLPPTVRTDDRNQWCHSYEQDWMSGSLSTSTLQRPNKQLCRSRWLCCSIWFVDCLCWDFVRPAAISLVMCQSLFNHEDKYNLVATAYMCCAFINRLALHLHCRQGPLPAGVKTFPSANTFWSYSQSVGTGTTSGSMAKLNYYKKLK